MSRGLGDVYKRQILRPAAVTGSENSIPLKLDLQSCSFIIKDEVGASLQIRNPKHEARNNLQMLEIQMTKA